MKRFAVLVLWVCLLLTGCGWLNGSYVSVTPHQQSSSGSSGQEIEAKNYLQLRTAIENMVSSGTESCVISVANFREDQLESSMEMAARYIKSTYPMGAYAVNELSYEIGTSGGVTAVAVQISYLHSRTELQAIDRVSDMEQVRELIEKALTRYDTGLVLLVDSYESADIQQFVEDFAAENPSSVMETPEVTEQTYPELGRTRVLELKFTYQTSRDNLRTMQEQVKRIFESAALYVSSDAQDSQKLSQLYSFLMERFTSYQIKTSITPAYSLLNHGVGDSEAFAVVYAEMCRKVGLDCKVVVGTRNGEPWYWNMVCDSGYYYHVDLLSCRDRGGYQALRDDQMGSYVWDYSAYPVCAGAPYEPEENAETQTEPDGNAETQTEPEDATVPEETVPETTETSPPSP